MLLRARRILSAKLGLGGLEGHAKRVVGYCG